VCVFVCVSAASQACQQQKSMSAARKACQQGGGAHSATISSRMRPGMLRSTIVIGVRIDAAEGIACQQLVKHVSS
jgi:hypothetical protein